MKRWFIGLRVNEKPHLLPEKLKNAVKHHGLEHFIIGIRYEKIYPFRRREHYIFLHVESEEIGDLWWYGQNLDSMLNALNLYNGQIYLTADDIENAQWISNSLEFQSFQQLRYQRTPRIASSDPLNYEEHRSHTQTSHIENYNHLLQWLSAYGQGTWKQFKTTCNTLGLDPTYEYSRRILRRLRLLGHIEITSDGQKWFIAPPSLVTTNSVDGRFNTFLAGQRSPALLNELRDAAQIEIETQPDGDTPDAIRATFDSQDQLNCFARDFRQRHHPLFLVGRAGHKIACALPHLVDWENRLSSPAVVLGNYKFELWTDGGFCSLPLPSQTGMYRLTHMADRHGHPQLTLFYDAGQNLWRRADWYGLRYLMLRRTGEHIEFDYDHNLRTLSIDWNQRLPHMYERALVLASGRLPLLHNRQVIFGDVSAELGCILADRLEAEFVESGRN